MSVKMLPWRRQDVRLVDRLRQMHFVTVRTFSAADLPSKHAGHLRVFVKSHVPHRQEALRARLAMHVSYTEQHKATQSNAA